MAANALPSHDAGADVLHGGAPRRLQLLDWLNRTIDRLFGFELEVEELRSLADQGIR